MFYSYFDYLCKHKGVTKNKACQEMGVSRNVAAKWKSTNTNPNMTTLSKISEYFGVSIDELLRHNEEEKPATISDGQEKNEEELLNIELMHRLTMLSPDELSRVDAFVQGILASR